MTCDECRIVQSRVCYERTQQRKNHRRHEADCWTVEPCSKHAQAEALLAYAQFEEQMFLTGDFEGAPQAHAMRRAAIDAATSKGGTD